PTVMGTRDELEYGNTGGCTREDRALTFRFTAVEAEDLSYSKYLHGRGHPGSSMGLKSGCWLLDLIENIRQEDEVVVGEVGRELPLYCADVDGGRSAELGQSGLGDDCVRRAPVIGVLLLTHQASGDQLVDETADPRSAQDDPVCEITHSQPAFGFGG